MKEAAKDRGRVRERNNGDEFKTERIGAAKNESVCRIISPKPHSRIFKKETKLNNIHFMYKCECECVCARSRSRPHSRYIAHVLAHFWVGEQIVCVCECACMCAKRFSDCSLCTTKFCLALLASALFTFGVLLPFILFFFSLFSAYVSYINTIEKPFSFQVCSTHYFFLCLFRFLLLLWAVRLLQLLLLWLWLWLLLLLLLCRCVYLGPFWLLCGKLRETCQNDKLVLTLANSCSQAHTHTRIHIYFDYDSFFHSLFIINKIKKKRNEENIAFAYKYFNFNHTRTQSNKILFLLSNQQSTHTHTTTRQ